MSTNDVTFSHQELNHQAWHLRDNDPQKSRYLSEQARNLAQDAQDALGEAYALTTLSFLDFRTQEYQASLEKYFKALEIFEAHSEKRWLPWVYNIYALIQHEIGNHPKALEFLLKQVELAKALGDPEQEAVGYHDLALFYLSSGDPKGNSFFTLALHLCQQHKDTRTEALIYLNQGITFRFENKHPEAIMKLAQCIALSQKHGYQRLELYAYKELMRINLQLTHLEAAQKNFSEIERLTRVCQEPFDDNYLFLSDLEFVRGDLDKALQHNIQALNFYTQSGHKIFLLECHQNLVKIFKAKGNFEKALEHHERYHHIHNSVFSENNQKRIQLMALDYQTHSLRKEAETIKQQHLKLNQSFQELQRRHRQVEALSVRDPLTNLFNRRYLFEYGEKVISQSLRYQHHLSIALVDIDHFKHINDTFSHAVGDKVIKTVADILQTLLRKADTVARLGGEEFVIVFPDTPLENANLVAERIRQHIQNYAWHDIQKNLQITVSIGLSCLDNNDFQEILHEADLLLYRAKDQGRNRICAKDTFSA